MKLLDVWLQTSTAASKNKISTKRHTVQPVNKASKLKKTGLLLPNKTKNSLLSYLTHIERRKQTN